jgi:hypothetical protein
MNNNIKIVRNGSHIIVGFRVQGNWAGACFGFGTRPSQYEVLRVLGG